MKKTVLVAVALLALIALTLGYRASLLAEARPDTPIYVWTTKNAFTHSDVSNFLAGLDAYQAMTAKVVRADWVIGTSSEAPFTIWYQEKH